MPRIIPTRTMRLEGRRVEFGKPVDVSDEAAELALRHGWATKAQAKAKAAKEGAPSPESVTPAAQAEQADAPAADASQPEQE